MRLSKNSIYATNVEEVENMVKLLEYAAMTVEELVVLVGTMRVNQLEKLIVIARTATKSNCAWPLYEAAKVIRKAAKNAKPMVLGRY